ncbi:MAG: TetR family transcriptional regulator [Candidatus Rokuibacteriota bacterium]|nr:MAG: TetR family transcriptional regulator [Candidatus Rokubacteria bacterium]
MAMGRPVPAQRFQDLVDAATAVFIAQGYRRTQMADVAAAMGVAKGTVYLSVASKEALFDVALRHADAPRPLRAPSTLPVRAPAPGRTIQYVRDRLAREPASATLREALARGRTSADGDEVGRILREIYDGMARNRTGIKLVDRCAADYPDLATLWFTQGRGVLLGDLTRYLEGGIRRGAFRRVADARVAARVLIETLVFWAVHRHWDPAPQADDPRAAEDTVIQMLIGALLRGAEERPTGSGRAGGNTIRAGSEVTH